MDIIPDEPTLPSGDLRHPQGIHIKEDTYEFSARAGYDNPKDPYGQSPASNVCHQFLFEK